MHDGTAETRWEEGIHDSACDFNRLPSVCRSEQSEQIYSMYAEGTEPSSRMSGEKTGAEAWLRALITKNDEDPNGMKLSANILPYQGVACLSAGSGSLQARLGPRVTA